MTGRAGRNTAGVVASVVLLACAIPAAAQTRPTARQVPAGPAPRAGSWEIGGGVAYGGGFDLGDTPAELTRNTPEGDPFTLFVTSSDVTSAPGVEGRIGYYLTPRFEIEGRVRFARPRFRISASGDTEGAPNVTAEESIDQYVVGGAALWHFTRPTTRTRVMPFVFGGAAYLRELHEGRELVETGREYQAGAGVKIWFGGARRRLGIRGDAALAIRDGGIDPDKERRPVPVAGASLIYLF